MTPSPFPRRLASRSRLSGTALAPPGSRPDRETALPTQRRLCAIRQHGEPLSPATPRRSFDDARQGALLWLMRGQLLLRAVPQVQGQLFSLAKCRPPAGRAAALAGAGGKGAHLQIQLGQLPLRNTPQELLAQSLPVLERASRRPFLRRGMPSSHPQKGQADTPPCSRGISGRAPSPREAAVTNAPSPREAAVASAPSPREAAVAGAPSPEENSSGRRSVREAAAAAPCPPREASH